MPVDKGSASLTKQTTKLPLPRTVVLLGWVSLLADISSEMVYPLMPIFVVVVLGSSATSLGWVEGIAAIIVALLTAWSGWRSDLGSRRDASNAITNVPRRLPWIRWGYGLPVLGRAILALAVAWPMVMLGRGVDRVGKGLRGSPRDALLTDAADPSQRGRAFGFHRAMDTTGATIGVLLAAGLMWWLVGSTPFEKSAIVGVAESAVAASDVATNSPNQSMAWAFRVVFGVSAVMGLGALALTFFLREAPVPQVQGVAKAHESEAVQKDLGTKLSKQYWIVCAIFAVFALANSSDTFLLLRASDVGLAPWAVVLAYALYNVTNAAIAYPAGIVSDRIGRWRVIGVGWGIYAIVYIGFAFTNELGIWPLMALYGVYAALTDGVGKALISDYAPRNGRGKAMGIFSMINGFALLVSSVLAGLLWDRVGHDWPFLIGAGVSLVAMCVLGIGYVWIRRLGPVVT